VRSAISVDSESEVSSIHTSPVEGEVGVVVPTNTRLPGSASVTVIGDTLTVPVVAVSVPIPVKSM